MSLKRKEIIGTIFQQLTDLAAEGLQLVDVVSEELASNFLEELRTFLVFAEHFPITVHYS